MIAWIYSENGSSRIPEHRNHRQEKSLCVFLRRAILRTFGGNRKNARTLKLSFEALSEPFFDHLDIKSDTNNATNRPVISV